MQLNSSGPVTAAQPRTSFLSRHHMLFIGLGAGLLNGLLGIGGGILIVPGLIFLRGVTPRVAVSTSLGAIFIIALVALGVHLSLSGFYFSALGTVILLVAGGLGSLVGSYLLNRIPQRWILFLFSGLAAFSAANLIVKALVPALVAVTAGEAPPLWGYLLIGAVAGLFSGMLGIGGGGLTVLGFAVLFHTPILGGLPLALAVNVANSGSGIAAQWRTKQILWSEVGRLVPSALVGIGVGVVIAMALPADQLRIIFALFFLYMSVRLFRRGLKR